MPTVVNNPSSTAENNTANIFLIICLLMLIMIMLITIRQLRVGHVGPVPSSQISVPEKTDINIHQEKQ